MIIFLAIITSEKEKMQLLLLSGKVFILAYAYVELVFDKGIFQKKVLKGNGTITCPGCVVPVLNYLAIKCLSLILI